MKRKSYSFPVSSVMETSSRNIRHCYTRNDSVDPSSEICKVKTQPQRNPFLGIIYTFSSCAFLTLTAVIVKKLSYISAGQLSFVRNAGIFAGSLPFGVFCVQNILGDANHRIPLLISGFTGATSVYLYIMTYTYLPLVEATIVLSTVPVVTTLVACVYLKESCGLGQSFCILISISGVLLSVRLPAMLSERDDIRFDYTYAIGLTVAVCSVITISITLVILRKINHIHFSVPMLYFSFVGMIENVAIEVVSSSFISPHCGLDSIMYMLIGIFGFAGNLTYMLALQVEAAGIVSILLSMEIVLSMVFQVVFFNENPDIYNINGAVLVISSVSILGIRNWLLTLPEESNTRKKLKFFLF